MQTITTRFDIVDALKNLNESQKSSLEAKFPFFVNGPAGSGKSVVLIARLHKLIEEHQKNETGILVTTFNKKIISMIFSWLKCFQTDQTTKASSENCQIVLNADDRKVVKIGKVTVYLMHFDALASQREGIHPKLVHFAEMIKTDFSKDTEDISNYYGKIGFIDHKDDDNVQKNNIEQQIQSRQLGLIARKLIWLDGIKNENACRAFKGDSEAVCEPYTQQDFKFDYIFIDECQDLWLADLCLFWHLLKDPALWRIGCFGDATQAVHVGASNFRNNVLKVPKPLQKLARDNKQITFNKAACMLEETYRIPQHLTKSLELVRAKIVPANKPKSKDSNPNSETGGFKLLANK